MPVEEAAVAAAADAAADDDDADEANGAAVKEDGRGDGGSASTFFRIHCSSPLARKTKASGCASWDSSTVTSENLKQRRTGVR